MYFIRAANVFKCFLLLLTWRVFAHPSVFGFATLFPLHHCCCTACFYPARKQYIFWFQCRNAPSLPKLTSHRRSTSPTIHLRTWEVAVLQKTPYFVQVHLFIFFLNWDMQVQACFYGANTNQALLILAYRMLRFASLFLMPQVLGWLSPQDGSNSRA